MSVIKTGEIQFKKCDKIKNRLLIGIDQGCTLTKVVFLNKLNMTQLLDETCQFVTFQWNLYKNEDFEVGMKMIRDLAYIPETSQLTLHLTGVGTYFRCEILESIFNLKVEIIPEEISIAAGIIIGLSEIGIETITQSVITPMTAEQIINNPFNKFYMSQNAKLKESQKSKVDSSFPCLVLNYGSASGFMYIDGDARSEFFAMYFNGGRTLLGLAKCLLNINSYEELTELASHGRRENIDTQIKDMLGINSSRFPKPFQDVPLFPFGRLDDIEFALEDCKKEDIALSLISMICNEIVTNCARAATIKNLSMVYLNGNLFQSRIFAEELQKLLSFFPLSLSFVILDYGYAGALAAMLCDANDRLKYMMA